jgi:hypothetical protein
MNITVTPKVENRIPDKYPFAIEFINGLVVFIVQGTKGIVVQQGNSPHPVGTYRDDWYVSSLLSSDYTKKWHGKIEIEI